MSVIAQILALILILFVAAIVTTVGLAEWLVHIIERALDE